MSDNFKTELSKKIYLFYPKYETLFEPTRMAYWSVKANQIDIYIDASNFIESMIKPTVEFDDNMGIVAGLINLAIHYRRFYLKHFNTYSRIFIVYSDRSNIYNKSMIPEYDSVFYNLYQTMSNYKTTCLQSNLELLSEVCKYLKDIYFVKTNIETAVKIRSLIMKYSKSNPVAIYSKDAFMCQIPAITPNAVFFKITKNGILERVEIVRFENAMQYYIGMHRRTVNLAMLQYVSPYLYSTLLALTNCKERNITLVMSPKQAISALSGAVCNGNLANKYPDIANLYSQLNVHDYINKDLFYRRFMALDILYQQSQYELTPEFFQNDWYIDINNNDALKEINDKYFIKTPLNINEL